MSVDRYMYIDALHGVYVPTEYAVKLTKRGLMEWNGNQHNESWKWKRSELETLWIGNLELLYTLFKKENT